MDGELVGFLRGRAAVDSEGVDWGPGYQMRVETYVGEALPPVGLVTSVRAVVLGEGRGTVLVQRDRTTRHILPGGRREGEEPLEEALRREVGEETGWELGAPAVLGVLHFHHLDPRPEGHRYPYPDFVQVVYAARATRFVPELMVDDGYEEESVFVPVAEARAMGLTRKEQILLDVAVGLGAGG